MIRIGARGSQLSTAQVMIVQQLIKKKIDLDSEFIPIKSHGDVNTSVPINKVVQEGAFTSTLESALVNNEVDIAVHSFKDLPTTNPDELAIVAVLKRHSPTDTLVIHKENVTLLENHQFELQKGTRIGTGSARRQSQLLHYFKGISTVDIRGNVETRLKKLAKRQYDGIILASAVFQRINLVIPEDCIKIEMDIRKFPTAPAQGAICIQMKKNHQLFSTLSQLNNEETKDAVELERAILKGIGGGCQLPLGVTIQKTDNDWMLNLTLAPKDWRDYDTIPLTKILIKESSSEQLLSQITFLMPKNVQDDELVLQNKEILFVGNNSTIAKYDSYVSSFGALTSTIDIQETFTNLSETLYSDHASEWLNADWVIISSKNAIHALNIFNKRFPKDNLKIASVGFSTTKLLQKFGYAVHYQGFESNAKSLAEGLKSIIMKDESLLYLSANNAKDTIRQNFAHDEYNFSQIEVYTTVVKKDLPQIPKDYCFDYVVIFSPEYARLTYENYGKSIGKTWVSIGPSTSKKLEELGIFDYKQLSQVTLEDLKEILK